MVYPVQPYPIKKLDGTWVWIDPKTNLEIRENTMNERIKDLYRQANEQARQNACTKNNTLRPQNNTVWNEFVPLFAELIVRECSQFVEDKFDFCGDELIIAEQILKHFGVEE